MLRARLAAAEQAIRDLWLAQLRCGYTCDHADNAAHVDGKVWHEVGARFQHVINPEDQFKAGDYVRYVPGHAHGDAAHEDCEDGRVTSVNDKYVFVNFGRGDTSAACDPHDLVKLR